MAALKLAVSVDAFCESIGFTPEQTERVFKTAQKLGLTVKLHAEQLSDLQGAKLAARYGALSAEHLEFVSEEGIKAMAASWSLPCNDKLPCNLRNPLNSFSKQTTSSITSSA